MRRSLTDAFLRRVRAPASGRVEISDLRCPGLVFRETAAGARSWSLRFRDPQSRKTTRATIGAYPTVPLAAARKEAEALRRRVAGGENPVTAKRRNRDTAESVTFGALAARYMDEHAKRHKRSSTADERNLNLHVLPKWRKRRYSEIERADVIELVEGLVKAGKPTLANRVQALVSSVFSFAIDAGLTKAHPAARLRRRGVETKGTRVLTDAELRLFWPGIMRPPVSRRVGLALRVVLLTCVRPGEAAGISRTELEHLDNAELARWIIPPERSKNGRAHLVPLSKAARETIASALAMIGDDDQFLFPSPAKRGRPVTAHALAVAMGRFASKLDAKGADAEKSWAGDPPTPHDLRRTGGTRLAELGIPKEDRDAILNHTPQDVGKKHYDLYDREREKRRALDLWATTMSAILQGENASATIIQISRTKAP